MASTRTRRQTNIPPPVEVARRAVEIAADQQAADIRLLDIRKLASFADYFVILTAESGRQMNGIMEELASGLAELGAKPHHQEGASASGWVLLDYSDVIIHIFAPAERQYFQLERLWAAAVPLIQIQ
jgi:ribosome-associated protein